MFYIAKILEKTWVLWFLNDIENRNTPHSCKKTDRAIWINEYKRKLS